MVNKTEVIDAESLSVKVRNGNKIESVGSAMVRIEIESQIATAKQYPRTISKFKQNAMSMATLDEETAGSCIYALPRGNSYIEGPSVRLAEIVLASYGNIVAEANVIDEDDEFVYAVGMCRDLENNTSVKVTIRRRIVDKYGKKYNADMIGVTSNAACAVALRNAIFKVVPFAFVKPVFMRCKQVISGNANTLVKRRVEVVERLVKMGIMEDRVLGAVNKQSIEDLTVDDVGKLVALGTACKEGDADIDTAFPEIKTPEKTAPSPKTVTKSKTKTRENFSHDDDTKKSMNANQTETESGGDHIQESSEPESDLSDEESMF